MTWHTVTIHGEAVPGGSKTHTKTKRGKVWITADNPLTAPWMDAVRFAFKHQHPGFVPIDAPIQVHVRFFMPRPLYHYIGRDPERGLKPDAPPVCWVKPDLTKIWRSTEDALTGLAWTEDARVVADDKVKYYFVDEVKTVVRFRAVPAQGFVA